MENLHAIKMLKFIILVFFAAAHPLVLVGQRVRSFDSPRGVHVLTVVAVHRFLVSSAQRAHPVTSVGHTGSLLEIINTKSNTTFMLVGAAQKNTDLHRFTVNA